MALTITHAKSVNIADNPQAAAAGEVLPSDWNANHTVSGTVDASIGGRTILTADKTYYYSGSGSDVTGDGSVGNPWATPTHALSALSGTIDGGGFNVYISGAAGTYAGVQVNAVPPNCRRVVFGDPSGTNAVIFNEGLGALAGYSCLSMNAVGIHLVCKYITFKPLSTGGGITFDAALNELDLFNCTFNGTATNPSFSCINFFTAENHSYINLDEVGNQLGTTTIIGNWPAFVNQTGGIGVSSAQILNIAGGGNSVTLTGTPAFSGAFVQTSECSVIFAQSATFSGAATGVRYSAVSNSVINTGGGGANFFPGNSAGSTATGGQYL